MEHAEANKLNFGKQTSVFTIGGFRPTQNPFSSHFGLAPVAAGEELWPTVGGEPMYFFCQFNLREAPFVPEILSDIALFTLYINKETKKRLGKQNGEGWLIRTYKTLDGLKPLTVPQGCSFAKGFEIRWERVEDYPYIGNPPGAGPGFGRVDQTTFPHLHRSKIGGYASHVQGVEWWNEPSQEWYGSTDFPLAEPILPHNRPIYCFQFFSEEKVLFYIPGVWHFARGSEPGREDHWYLDQQYD